MTHVDMKNIALKTTQFNRFFVLDLQFYEWYWVKAWGIISVKENAGERLYEVKKYERDGDKILAVVVPLWEVKP